MRFSCFHKTFILIHLSLNVALPRAKILSVGPVLTQGGLVVAGGGGCGRRLEASGKLGRFLKRAKMGGGGGGGR